MKLKRDKVYKLSIVEVYYKYGTMGLETRAHCINVVFIATSYFTGKVLMVNENPYCKNGSELYFSSADLKKHRREGKLIKLL